MADVKPDGVLEEWWCSDFTHLLPTTSHLLPRDSLFAVWNGMCIRLFNQQTCGAELYPSNQSAVCASGLLRATKCFAQSNSASPVYYINQWDWLIHLVIELCAARRRQLHWVTQTDTQWVSVWPASQLHKILEFVAVDVKWWLYVPCVRIWKSEREQDEVSMCV